MSEKIIENLARILKEIKVGVKEGVIKDSHISDLCDVKVSGLIGFAVFMTLSTKFVYTGAVLENWRKRLGADDYQLIVFRNQLKIRFDVPYSEDMQEP